MSDDGSGQPETGTHESGGVAVDRRNLLKMLGAGSLATAELSGVSGAEETSGQGDAELTSGGDQIWAFDKIPPGHRVVSSPTVVNGIVYVGSADVTPTDIDGTLYAVNADSGEKKWEFDKPSEGIESSPTVVDDVVYIGSKEGTLYAVNANSGEKKWEFDKPSEGIESSPTVADGIVYVGSGDFSGGPLYAVDADSGKKEWEYDGVSGLVISSPTVVDGIVYVGDTSGTLHAVKADSGERKWDFDEPVSGIRPSPTVADGIVYVGAVTITGGILYAVKADSGEKKWEFDKPSVGIESSPTVADGIVYVGSGDTYDSQNGTLYAVDADSGDLQWKFEELSGSFSSPTVADGIVYVGSGADDDALYAVDSGEKEWRFDNPSGVVDSSPTVVEGTVYVGSNDGTLYAVDAGVEGSSEGSRVDLGTLGHHHVWAGEDPPVPTGTVSGQVTNEAETVSDVTLEFVSAETDTPEETTTTDDSGNYEVELPVGNYVITALADGFEPTEIPVPVEDGTTSIIDIELTAQNPPVTISNFEIGPDSLLSGTDTDLGFFLGVETDDEADVEVDTVEVLYRDSAFSAQQITDVDGVTLRESLHRATNTGPFLIPFPVDFAKELLNLPAKQIYLVNIPQGPTPLKNGDNRFRMRVTGSDSSSYTVEINIPQYSQGDRLASFNTTAFGPDVNFNQNFFDFDKQLKLGEDSLPDNLPVDLAVSLFDADLEYTGDGSLNLNTLAATAASRSAGGISVLNTAGIEFQLGGRWDGATNDFSYNLNLVDLWIAGLLQFPVPLPKKLKLQTRKIPRIGKVKFELGLNLIPSGYLLLGNSDPNTPGIETATSVSNNSDTADTRTVQSANAEFPISEREFNIYFTIEATAASANNNQGNNNQNNGGINVEAFVSGSIYQGNDITLPDVILPSTGLLPLEAVGGEVSINGGVKFSALKNVVSATLSIKSIADFMGWDPSLPIGEIRDPPCWEVFDIDGNCQEYPSPSSLSRPATGYDISDSDVGYGAPTGQNPPADAFTAETEAAVLTRLTDRAEIDGSPAIAARTSPDEQGEHLAVWERHPEDTPVEDGRTLVTATRDGTGWSDPTTLADTTAAGESYHQPAVATDAGTTAIAWTRYETEGADTPPPLDEATQIELIVEDDTGWSDPVVVAETSDWFDSNPAIAPLGDGWVVAWERAKLDNNTRAVGYAVLDATGAVQRSETIMEATQLGVTQFDVGIGDDSVVLGYYDRATQQIRRDLITQSDRTTDQTYDLAEGLSVRDLSIAAQDTAWLVTDEETTTGFYATGTSVEELSFVSLESSLSGLNLVETIAGPVLTAARVPEEDVRERSFIYHLRDGDTWRPEQVPASTDASGDVKLTESAVAPTTDGDGLVSLVEAKVHDPEAVSDIAAVEQPLRPHYSITAEADQETVPPGKQMTVSYTIENTGDLDGDAIGDDPVMVEARSQGNTLADQQESPLARGETATGELTFTVDETGTVDIVVGRELDLLDPEEQRTTIEGSTPLLGVNSVAVERPNEGTAIGTVQIRNGGPVDAQDFDIEVYAGDDTVLGEAQVNGPAAGERSAVTVEFEPGELVLTGREQVHIDPGEDLPESHVTQRVSPVLLGQPDITVAEDIKYGEADSDAVATLEMTNAGPVPTSAVVRAVRADATPEDGSFADEDLLGTVEVDLPAAIDGAPQTTKVVVTLEGVGYGEEVRFVVGSDRPVAGAGIPVVYDRVGPFGAGIRALPGYSEPPQDLDGDGLYEDVDGDGEFDIFDVQALFIGFESDPVQDNPKAFNFSDNDNPEDVTIFDVQGLFELLK